MTKGFDFNQELAKRIEAVYQTQDAVRRRQAILEVLNLKAGEQVLDVGTGPGFVAREMADVIGPTGKIECVDISDSMLELAKKRCADKSWISFQTANALELPFPSGRFDVAVSVQVLEYVKDLKKALTEFHRILRPGGRAVVVSTDWDSMIWHALDKERMRKILSAFREHCAYSDLPRTLASKLRQAGFHIQKQRVITQFNPVYDPDTYSYHIIGMISSFVPGRKGVTQEEAEAWAEDLRQVGQLGDYFFCVNQFLHLVTKPE